MMKSVLVLFATLFLSLQISAHEYQFGFTKEFQDAYFKKDKNNQHLWIPYEDMIRERINAIKNRPNDPLPDTYLLVTKFPKTDKNPQQQATCTVQDAYNTEFAAAASYSEKN